MQNGLCVVPLAAVYALPDYGSELVNQLLFGEGVLILETPAGLFCKVRGVYDGYEGWVHKTQVQVTDKVTATPLVQTAIAWQSDLNMWLPMGSVLPAGIITAPPLPDEGVLRAVAMQWLHAPYLWGGRSVLGVDCSGFTQVVYKMVGFVLPRDAKQQVQLGTALNFLQEAKCGDLAFFDNEQGDIIHVGILLSDAEIIHAAGKVRIDKIDNAGIVNSSTGLRTHRLRIIKRYF
ncbi:MAG: hydrolase Nlp/P60 [Sphingobacteriales bacterium]|nr:MAG: hydrolase Nlp/P60 [Sphingobacteriales bacterium]